MVQYSTKNVNTRGGVVRGGSYKKNVSLQFEKYFQMYSLIFTSIQLFSSARGSEKLSNFSTLFSSRMWQRCQVTEGHILEKTY